MKPGEGGAATAQRARSYAPGADSRAVDAKKEVKERERAPPGPPRMTRETALLPPWRAFQGPGREVEPATTAPTPPLSPQRGPVSSSVTAERRGSRGEWEAGSGRFPAVRERRRLGEAAGACRGEAAGRPQAPPRPRRRLRQTTDSLQEKQPLAGRCRRPGPSRPERRRARLCSFSRRADSPVSG